MRWPFWWYTQGFVQMISFARQAISHYARQIALGVWIKNIFVPMYGARDWQSRIISFFMRSVQIVARSFLLFFYSLMICVLLVIYLIAPILVAVNIVFHFSALFISV